MEDPAPLARAYVVAANVTDRRVLDAPAGERRTDHDHVPHDERRRVPADDAVGRRLRAVEFQIQIDHPFFPKGAHRLAGLGVEGHQAISLGHANDAFLLAVGPVGDTPSRLGVSRALLGTGALFQAVHPQRFSRRGIDRDHIAARARSRVEHPANHERRCRVVKVDAWTEVARTPPPGNVQLCDVLPAHLIEGRILGAPGVPSEVAPLPVGGPGLSEDAWLRRDTCGGQPCHRQNAASESTRREFHVIPPVFGSEPDD